MEERPECELKISNQCTGEAIMRVTLEDGTTKNVCHYCYWLKTRGKEWGSK